MSTTVLATAGFWRDLLERVGRQLAQTALPIVAAVGAAGSIDVKPVFTALAGAAVLTVLKALVTVKYTPGEDALSALVDRAVPAAAGTALGMLSVDVLDIMGVDWSAVAWAAAAAAVIAMLAYYVTPPTVPPTPVEVPQEPAPGGDVTSPTTAAASPMRADDDPLGPTEVL